MILRISRMRLRVRRQGSTDGDGGLDRSMAVIAYLGLGANEGDRERQIHAAIQSLAALPGLRVLAVSSLRETEAVGGPPDQGPYLNGVARIETDLDAATLLDLCKQLEREAGRDISSAPNSSRPLDLDLLLFGDQRIDTKNLIVPHPRMWDRDFVLQPLAEIGVESGELARPDSPRVCEDVADFSAVNMTWLAGGCVTGLVPTMGALHDGHVSLLRAARAECDRVAATIFVNPKQFDSGDDLGRYPRTFEQDLEILRAEGVDVVYAPDSTAMYPEGFCTDLAIGTEAKDLEGAFRPGHFAGVATVVAKLFAVARPTRAYFGEKDAQQLAVIRRMASDLDFPIMIRACPIQREPDGLALSSRNAHLSVQERKAALSLSSGLIRAQELFLAGESLAESLRAAALAVIEAEPLVELEYLELRNEEDLAPLDADIVTAARMLVAARVGATRLIDNISLGSS